MGMDRVVTSGGLGGVMVSTLIVEVPVSFSANPQADAAIVTINHHVLTMVDFMAWLRPCKAELI